MLPASLSFSSVSPAAAVHVTKLSPPSRSFRGVEPRASSGANRLPAPLPETLGSLLSASRGFQNRAGIAPARSIKPPQGLAVVKQHLQHMQRENCWWPSRTASDCADWMKPRARSVYFRYS